VQEEGGTAAQGDVPFTPEIYSGGSFHPICLADLDNTMVTATCKAAGFLDGGLLVENEDRVHAVDTVPA
jgi:hypothetical protein